MCDCSSFELNSHLLTEIESIQVNEFDEIYLIEFGKPKKLLKKDDLKRNTAGFKTPQNPKSGQDRIDRSENATLLKYSFDKEMAKKYGNQYNVVTYRVMSKENTEKTNDGHHGYVVYNKSNKNLKEVWCDCSDYFYRVWAAFEKAGFSTFDLDKKFQKYVKQKHNREWTKETNPEGTLFLCKHLLRVMTDVLDMNNLSNIVLARDGVFTKEEQELRKDIESDIQDQVQDQVPEKDTELHAPTEEPSAEQPTQPVEAPKTVPTPPTAPTPKVAPKPVKTPKEEPVVEPEPKKEEPSSFEKNYDAFNDELEKEEEAKLKAYEDKKKKENKITPDKKNSVTKIPETPNDL